MRQRFLVVVSAHTPLKLFRLTRLRLRLLLPSIALIVPSTMVPTELRHPSLAYFNNLFTAADFVSNLVLYVPLAKRLVSRPGIPRRPYFVDQRRSVAA